MTIKAPVLPPYPANQGPIAARQLESASARYRKQIEEIDAELEKTEEAFAAAFIKADVKQNARDRIAALAKSNRDANRR
jgi:hypothetical protein